LVDDFAQVQAGVRYRFEHLDFGIQLGVRGYYVLVLLRPEFPLHHLLGDPELVLNLRLEHIFVVLRSSFQLLVIFRLLVVGGGSVWGCAVSLFFTAYRFSI